MNKNIEPKNDKGQNHGYWERYLEGELYYKCFFINGQESGYEEYYKYIDTNKVEITFNL